MAKIRERRRHPRTSPGHGVFVSAVALTGACGVGAMLLALSNSGPHDAELALVVDTLLGLFTAGFVHLLILLAGQRR